MKLKKLYGALIILTVLGFASPGYGVTLTKNNYGWGTGWNAGKQAVGSATLTGHDTFIANDLGSRRMGVLLIDPGGGDRNFNPSGSFNTGDKVLIENMADAAETITFDSAGIAAVIDQDESGSFIYNGATWEDISTGTSGAASSFTKVTIIPTAAQLTALDIQGETYDYTGAGVTGTIVTKRDINQTALSDHAGISNYLNLKHGSAQTSTINYAYADISRVDNNAIIKNNTTNNDIYHEYGTYSWIDDKGGLYDTQSTGQLEVVITGVESYVETTDLGNSDRLQVSDTGGSDPTKSLEVTGFHARMFHGPEIVSGAWTMNTTGFDATIRSEPIITAGGVTQNTYGVKVDVDADTTGTSTAYGIYIDAVAGADTNYGLYDNSGAPSVFTGSVTVNDLYTENGATSAGSVYFYEDSDNGTNTVQLIGPAATADVVQTLQAVTGTVYCTGGADIAEADGGTGASTFAAAPFCLESVFGDAKEADDFTLSGTTFSLVAEIPHLDVAETVGGNWDFTANPHAVNEGGTGASTVAAMKQGFEIVDKWPTWVFSAPLATDDKCFWVAPVNITITDIQGILFSGGAMTATIKECDSAGANCAVCDSAYITFNGGLDEDDGTLSNGTIDAGDVVGVDIEAVNGDEGDFMIWFKFTVD